MERIPRYPPGRRRIVGPRPKLGTELVLVEVTKAEVPVQRRVPRDLPEGGQGDSRQAARRRPRLDLVEQCPSDAGALVVGVDADLLDVGAAIDDVDDDVANRPSICVDRDPGSALVGVASEDVERQGFVVGDLRHAHLAEASAGATLDLLDRCAVVGPRWSDGWGHTADGHRREYLTTTSSRMPGRMPPVRQLQLTDCAGALRPGGRSPLGALS